MKRNEAEQYIGKTLKLVLSNNFHFSGKVMSVNEDTLEILDKFSKKVSIKLSSIILCEEVLN